MTEKDFNNVPEDKKSIYLSMIHMTESCEFVSNQMKEFFELEDKEFALDDVKELLKIIKEVMDGYALVQLGANAMLITYNDVLNNVVPMMMNLSKSINELQENTEKMRKICFSEDWKDAPSVDELNRMFDL